MEASLAGLETVFRWLLKASWEAAVLIVLIFLAQRLLVRWLEPRWRYALWMLVVVRLALPIQWESEYSIFNFARIRSLEQAAVPRPAEQIAARIPEKPSDSQVELTFGAFKDRPEARFNSVSANEFGSARPVSISSGTAPNMDSKAITSPSTDRWNKFTSAWTWSRGLAAVWLAGVLLFIGCIALETWKWQARLAKRRPMHDTNVLAELTDCQLKLSVAKPLPLEETGAVTSPALFGLFRPRLLLPEGMAETFSKSELRFVFLHELAHLKRNDIAVNWLMTILLAIHWFNPFVWLAFRRMRVDRELACDSLALSQIEEGQRLAYGQTILKLLEGFQQRERVPGMVGILEDKQAIKQRLRMIAWFRSSKRWSLAAGAVMATLAFFTLTGAQTPEPRKDASENVTQTNRPLIFKVIDAETRHGLEAELKVSICDENSCRPFDAFTTDSLGMHAFNLPENVTGLTIWVRRQGYVPKVLSWSKFHNDRIPSEYTVKLDRGASIGGIVYNEDGLPIQGVKVSIDGGGINPNEREHLGLQGNFLTETTDVSGRWVSDSVPPKYEQITLHLSHPDYSSTSFPFTKDLWQKSAVMVMKKGSGISGIVVGKDGLPIVGAKVRLGDSKHMRNPVTGITDEKGRFRFEHQPTAKTAITVQAKGFAPEHESVEVDSSGANVRIELEIGAVINGRVVDNFGKPIDGAMIGPDFWRGKQLLDWDARTDSEGRFSWDSAPLENVTFYIGKKGYFSNRGTKLMPGASENLITLQKAGIVKGRVSDAETGLAIPMFKVFFGDGSRVDGKARYHWQRHQGKSGYDGQFAIEFSEDGGGIVSMLIEAKGYGAFISEPFKSDDGDKSFEIKLKKVPDLSGRVVYRDGRPVVDATAILCTATDRAYMDIAKQFHLGLYECPHDKTDEDGSFTFPPTIGVEAIVVAHEDGFAEYPLTGSETNSLKIELQPWGKVEGTLKIGNEPGVGQEIWISNQFWRDEPFPHVQLYLKTKTDGNGYFVIDGVPPGEHQIKRLAFQAKAKEGTIPLSHDQPIIVKAGETTQVSMGGKGRPVIGKVVLSGAEHKIDWTEEVFFFETCFPGEMKYPSRLEYESNEAFKDAGKLWTDSQNHVWKGEHSKRYQREKSRYVLVFQKDGSFRIDDIPPGTYELALRLHKPDQLHQTTLNEIAILRKRITIDPISSGRIDEPFDLGTLQLKVHEKSPLELGM